MSALVESRAAAQEQEENDGGNKIPDAVFNLHDQLQLIVVPADVQMVQIKEEAPEEQRPDVDQQDPEPLHIKEEEEELWTSLEGEQLSVKEETDATSFSFPAVPLKSEDDEEKPLFSQLHQVEVRDLPSSSSAEHMEAATGGESCGGAETTRNTDLNTHEDDSDSSETEVSEDDEEEDDDVNNPDSQLNHFSDSGSKTEDSDEDWEESRAPESGVNTVNKCFSCSECDVQMVQIKEEAPEEQRPDVDQQDPEPLHIKEEEEELWTSLEGEQLSVKEETDATSFSFPAVPLKSEDDEEKPLFSQLHQVEVRDLPSSSSAEHMEAATGGESCGGAETTRNTDLNTHEDDSDSSETEVSEDDEEEDDDVNNPDSQLNHFSDSGSKTEDSDEDWEESRAPESGVNTVNKCFSCSECVVPADVQMVQIKEEAPEEQRPDVDQQDPEPLHIKEEEEELWTSLEGEQLSVKEETDATSFSFPAVPLKSEDDEEKPLFSQLHQVEVRDLPSSSSAEHMEAATGGESCGGAETTRNTDLNTHEDDSDSSETEVSEDDEEEDDDVNNPDSQLNHFSDSGSKTEDSDEDWEESRAPESGVNTVNKCFSCSECVVPADVQMVQIKEEAPEEQRPDVDQQDPEPLHIKEEEEELWTSLEGEQLSVKEETDATSFSFPAVPLKSEDDEEKPLFSQLHQVEVRDLPSSSSAEHMEAATGGESCGGAETTRHTYLNTHEDDSDSSETEVSEDDEEEDDDVNNPDSQLNHFSDSGSKTEDWEESRAPESGVNTVNKCFSCSECVVPADVQMVQIKEEAPEEQRPDVDQQDPEPLHIKEEEEELWTSLEGEQLSVKEETDATSFSFPAVPLKSEDDEEKPLFSQLHQVEVRDLPSSSSAEHMEAATGGESCGGAETTRHTYLNTHEDDSDSSETEVSEDDEEEDDDVNNPDSQLNHFSDSGSKTEDSDEDWEESRAPESGVNTVNKCFSCSECGKQYVNNRSLQRHLTSHSVVRSSNCLVKRKPFKMKKIVDSHRKFHKSPNLFRCDDCDKKFTTKANLDRHMRIHTGEKPFGCDVCGRRFIEKGDLNVHMRVHTGEKPFGCEVCGQSFGQRGNLTIHMRIHTGHKPYGCEVCGQRFGQKGNLKTHMRLHTGQKPFACDVCGRSFNQKEQLNAHVRIHLGQKMFSCGVCEQRFTEKGSLNKHTRNHMVQKQFCCDVCGRRFSRKGHLNRHTRVHTGQKPFSCDVCGRRFSEKGHLKTHIRIHTGQKPFSCDVCGRRFSEKGHLKGHMRIHTGQKPFGCDACGRKFSEKGNLNRHMKIHIEEKAVVCNNS
ncbi:zinc finger X-chromosomal protein isoform X6 [Kryptolebias marmoratus]|uniref:zinc finger X-chromosomal protein isoform X6 n=1 Tax=Kryptolebias marmoratus TaxID=37003 RepID=UPI0007F940CE|nr:zinc finger X-chromosomal protein isoform X6 [Kryptolebias marmoratus]